MIDPPMIRGTDPSTPRAPRVETPRAINTCEIHPVSSTIAAPNTQGRIEIHPASCCEKPRPLIMKGVNQVSPSDSAQEAPNADPCDSTAVGSVRFSSGNHL